MRTTSCGPRLAVLLGLVLTVGLATWPIVWAEATPVLVTDVRVVDAPAEQEVIVTASGPIRYALVDLNPNWIAVDVRDATLVMSGAPRSSGTGEIQSIRVSQHAPGVVRIIVELDAPVRYRVSASADATRVMISIPGQAVQDTLCSARAAPAALTSAEPIDLNARDQEITDVLSALARIARASLVTDPSVRGRITVHLIGVTFRKALQVIADQNDLSLTITGNTIVVAKRDRVARPSLCRYPLANIAARDFVANILPVTGLKKEQVAVDNANNAIFVYGTPEEQARVADLLVQVDVASELVTMRVIKLNYIDAAAFLDLLGALPDTVVRAAKVNRATNSIVLTATAAQMLAVDALLSQVDTPLPQVMIEASVTEIPTEVIKTLGVAWQTATALTITSPGANPATGQLQFSVAAPTITAILNTLIQESKARLLANPRLAVRDGETADMTVGDKIPFQVLNAQGVPSIVILDAGVKLRITPRINRDGYLTILMHPEVSEIATAPAPGVPPTIATREADTSLTVRDGTPIVLAGLIQKNATRTTVKVPLLGDIPILGWLFKSTSTDTKDTEVVFIVTPHILPRIG